MEYKVQTLAHCTMNWIANDNSMLLSWRVTLNYGDHDEDEGQDVSEDVLPEATSGLVSQTVIDHALSRTI